MDLGKVKVPGVAWSALLIALAAVVQANFENAIWYQVVMLVIAGALKGMDLNFQPVVEKIAIEAPQPQMLPASRSLPDDDVPALEAELISEPEPYWQRFLLG